MCDQRSLRSACTHAQTDQSHCWSLEYSMGVMLLTEHHLEFLSVKAGCTGSSESSLVKMPHCWKSHATAHIISTVNRIDIPWFCKSCIYIFNVINFKIAEYCFACVFMSILMLYVCFQSKLLLCPPTLKKRISPLWTSIWLGAQCFTYILSNLVL